MRCYISGRVQGVWFRASTREQALQLGVSGYARNLTDGRVEVLACGEPAVLETLKAWLWKGPIGARVDGVTCKSVEESLTSGFVTK